MTPAVLVGPDLEPASVKLHSLSEGVLRYFDEDRLLQTTEVDEFLMIHFASSAVAEGPPSDLGVGDGAWGVLLLNDGQRLVGTWLGADPGGQILHWEHPFLGALQVNLESISALSMRDPALAVAAPAGDRIILSNGDRLEGFILSVGPQSVRFRPQGGREMQVPRDRIGAMQLANPTTAPAATDTAHLVWLRDGTRVRARAVGVSGDQLIVTPTDHPKPHQSGEEISMPLDRVARIDIAGARGHLRDLVEIPMVVASGGEVFGVAMPPQRAGRDLVVHGPVQLRFELPAKAERVAVWAHLDVSSGQTTQAAWADLDVSVSIDGQTLVEGHLDAAAPVVAVNVPVDGLSLQIELSEGANGPIMDRVRLKHGVVLVRN